jgi:signal transduction histidine kinase
LAKHNDTDMEWLGRLVKVLVVFRSLVLLITAASLPGSEHTPLIAVLVLAAVVISYVPLRHWSRIAPSLSRHPAYLALEVALAMGILAAAGVRSPFLYFTLGTAALAGVIYGRRGAIPFSLLLMSCYELVALGGASPAEQVHDRQLFVLVPLLYPLAVVAGVAAREVVQRGVTTELLLRERTEALAGEQERVRVARELHDSLAKTVEGLAMTASVLPARCERNPRAAAELARELAADARQAALEARALMSDLRPAGESKLSLVGAVRGRAESVAQRSGVNVEVLDEGDEELPADRQHELLRIVGEAMLNAVRHGGAGNLTVSVRADAGETALTVADDGCGIPSPVDFDQLKTEGHFGLAGMRERAQELGGEMTVRSTEGEGTVVTVTVPVSAASAPATVTPMSKLRARLHRRRQPVAASELEKEAS